MEGYAEATKIDELIDELLEKEPLTKVNAMQWLRFSRSVRTGLDIIEEDAKALLITKRLGGMY